MQESRRPARDGDGTAANPSACEDFEYDEAHDAPSWRTGAAPPPPVKAPEVTIGDGGDYGYDEAHDLGRR